MSAAAPESSFRLLLELPRQAWILAVASFVNRAGTMVLPFLALYLTRAASLPASTAGFMVTLYGLGALVAALLAGRICDRYGSAGVAAISLALSGALLLVFPLTSNPLVIGLITLGYAMAAESFRPASMALAGELVGPPQRRVMFALHRLATNLGMSIGPAMGGLLIAAWPAGIFLVDGATALLASLILAVYLLQNRVARAGVAGAAEREPARPGTSRRAHTDRAFLWFLLAVFAVAVVFFQQQAAMPLYLVRDLGFSERSFGLVYTINTALIIAFELPLTVAITRWPPGRALAAGAALCGVGFGALGFASGFWGLACTVVIWTVGEMLLFPAASTYVADASPPGRSGEYMGAFAMAMNLALVVGPWAGTALLEELGGRVFWLSVLALGLLSAALMTRVCRAASTS